MATAKLRVLLAVVAVSLAASEAARADEVIGSFEGDLTSSRFNDWQLGFDGDLAEEPSALSGIVGTSFLSDDPGDTDSEGVTEGSQSLELEYYQWESVFKPYLYLAGGADLAQAILDSDGMSFDFTPIVPAEGWDETLSWRQAFLSITSNTNDFGQVKQIDYTGELDVNGNPTPQTFTWDFDTTQFPEDEGNPFDVNTVHGYAQEALDAGEEAFFTLRVIFQGRDIDENGALIGFNAFNPTSVKATVDNIRFDGIDPPGGTGDFDGDNDTDGADFLAWQQGVPGTYGAADLADWQTNYGAGAPALGALSTVPEPAAVGLAIIAIASAMQVRRRSEVAVS
ncbi:MAG: hypothetical protein AAGD11_04195 [Planctomycetota bacterium]